MFRARMTEGMGPIGTIGVTLLLIAGLGRALPADAGPVGFSYNYDGTYDPYTATPPAGQDTWSNSGGTLSPTPDTPAPGLARFLDTSAGARLTMNKTFGSNVSGLEWEYVFDMNLASQGSAYTLLGVRDEFGAGRSVMFSFAQSNSNIFYVNSAAAIVPGNIYTQGTGAPSFKNQQHQYRVVKHDVGGTMKVGFYIDGVLFDERDYSTFPAFTATTNGFGFFGSTPGTVDATVADVHFGPPTALPIPMVSETFRYDGSYAPDSASPPPGQSTWTVVTTGGLAIQPNTPGPGLASFPDNSAGGRIQMNQVLTDATFLAKPEAMAWEYDFRMSVTSPGYPRVLFGVRDEGGSGKAIMFAHSSTGDNLFYTDTAGNVLGTTLYVGGVNGPGLGDGQFHDYRVVKSLQNDSMMISFYLDGALLDTRSYASFPGDGSSNLGFGLFTATPGTSNYVIDSAYFGPVVPEPASGVLLLAGGVLMLPLVRRRKREILHADS